MDHKGIGSDAWDTRVQLSHESSEVVCAHENALELEVDVGSGVGSLCEALRLVRLCTDTI